MNLIQIGWLTLIGVCMYVALFGCAFPNSVYCWAVQHMV